MSNETQFSINITAPDSGELYTGTFKVRKRLSHIQRLRMDEFRRSLLGLNPAGAIDDAVGSSLILATCQAHIIEAPKWWEKSNSGLDLLDQEPLVEIYNKIKEVQVDDKKDLVKQAEQASADLKK